MFRIQGEIVIREILPRSFYDISLCGSINAMRIPQILTEIYQIKCIDFQVVRIKARIARHGLPKGIALGNMRIT